MDYTIVKYLDAPADAPILQQIEIPSILIIDKEQEHESVPYIIETNVIMNGQEVRIGTRTDNVLGTRYLM
jgi:uncharacterized Fe-S center protein